MIIKLRFDKLLKITAFGIARTGVRVTCTLYKTVIKQLSR